MNKSVIQNDVITMLDKAEVADIMNYLIQYKDTLCTSNIETSTGYDYILLPGQYEELLKKDNIESSGPRRISKLWEITWSLAALCKHSDCNTTEVIEFFTQLKITESEANIDKVNDIISKLPKGGSYKGGTPEMPKWCILFNCLKMLSGSVDIINAEYDKYLILYNHVIDEMQKFSNCIQYIMFHQLHSHLQVFANSIYGILGAAGGYSFIKSLLYRTIQFLPHAPQYIGIIFVLLFGIVIHNTAIVLDQDYTPQVNTLVQKAFSDFHAEITDPTKMNLINYGHCVSTLFKHLRTVETASPGVHQRIVAALNTANISAGNISAGNTSEDNMNRIVDSVIGNRDTVTQVVVDAIDGNANAVNVGLVDAVMDAPVVVGVDAAPVGVGVVGVDNPQVVDATTRVIDNYRKRPADTDGSGDVKRTNSSEEKKEENKKGGKTHKKHPRKTNKKPRKKNNKKSRKQRRSRKH